MIISNRVTHGATLCYIEKFPYIHSNIYHFFFSGNYKWYHCPELFAETDDLITHTIQNHKDETFSCKKSELDPASGVLGFHSYHFNVSVASIRSSIYDGEKAILDLPGKEIRFKRNETDQRHSNDKETQIGDYLKLFLWYFVLDRFSSQ